MIAPRHCLGVFVWGDGMAIKGQAITILGAGIAGLTLARALALRGADVTVIEQAPQIAEVGAGLQIAPNGAAVLRALGLGAALGACAMQARAVRLLDGRNGAAVVTLDLQRRDLDRDYHFVHRADLIDLLARGARDLGVQIDLGAQIAAVDLTQDAPVLGMMDGSRRAAPLVIGADGVHSCLRTALLGASDAFFTGQVAWRALIAGAGANAGYDVEVHMGAGRHVVSYPLRGGQLRNIVAVQERATWTAESWSQQADPNALRAAFTDFGPQVQDYLSRVNVVSQWGLFRHPIARDWGRIMPLGAAFILGDAAHPTLPFLAQGASMAMEDAWVLAETLDAYPLPQALAHYQALRAPRVARIIAAANANARNYHLSGVSRWGAHRALRVIGRVAPDLMLRRFDWLYGVDVTRS
jgi:salicylate hydroxylase